MQQKLQQATAESDVNITKLDAMLYEESQALTRHREEAKKAAVDRDALAQQFQGPQAHASATEPNFNDFKL